MRSLGRARLLGASLSAPRDLKTCGMRGKTCESDLGLNRGGATVLFHALSTVAAPDRRSALPSSPAQCPLTAITSLLVSSPAFFSRLWWGRPAVEVGQVETEAAWCCGFQAPRTGSKRPTNAQLHQLGLDTHIFMLLLECGSTAAAVLAAGQPGCVQRGCCTCCSRSD
jgi:hypothetical protein